MSQAEADYGMTDNAFANAQANGRYAADATLMVKFYKHPRLNKAKSKEEGRPIFEETDYISIMQPGNKDSIIIRPAMDMDKTRFAEHFRKYELRMDQNAVEGTLLEEWTGVTRSQAAELRFFNVRTVEQLASMSDTNSQGMMGINMLKQQAIKYLEASKESATAEALTDANEQIAELRAMVEAMQAGQQAPAAEATDELEEVPPIVETAATAAVETVIEEVAKEEKPAKKGRRRSSKKE